MKKISIIGLGYIGLPTAIVAAEHGFEVVGFDVDAQRVGRINNCDPVIDEPEVYERLKSLIESKKFYATTVLEPADCFVIAVPTPFKDQKKADLSYVYQATQSLVPVLKKGDVVILESTIPVGTTDFCAQLIEQETGMNAGSDFFVAHCPERVLPGKIFYELIYNARIIGGINQASMNQAKLFYKQFVKGSLYLTNATAAEMVKLVENSSRDVAIAFANQVASMAYSIGLDPFEIIELANKHPRVKLLNPSCGVGGHCIAVDPWFLVETFPEQSQLLKTARMVNDTKPHQVISCVQAWADEWHKKYQKKPTVLALGLTFKADVNDLRESPALEIAQHLSQETTFNLLVCEPHVDKSVVESMVGKPAVSLHEGIDQADIIVCLVHHSDFKKINRSELTTKKILDFCGLFYQPHQESEHQEQLFWPASSTDSMTPFEPHVASKYATNDYKEHYS
jgi:UDP-N-acetyl-D-mannosaminuronic acid dehydrogenase